MKALEERKSIIIGWIHSHPYFSNDPSSTDFNQALNYQKLFAKSCTIIYSGKSK